MDWEPNKQRYRVEIRVYDRDGNDISTLDERSQEEWRHILNSNSFACSFSRVHQEGEQT